MKATQSTINDFFALTGTIFSIPVYQRNYTWEEENCEKLLQDIVSISQNKKTHFMGSITYILHLIDDEKSLRRLQEFVIIDGQQRITTLMLLLKAIETKIQNEGIKKEIDNLLNLSGQRLRLKPIKSDKEAFDLVMQNRSHELQGGSHIRNNYKFFTKELENYISKGYRIEEIYGAFLRLKIVAVGLELGEDDPQVVFESINATGVQLKGLDLIRNYLMMGENSDRQKHLYETYWVPLENWLGEKDLNDFIKTYLRIYLENKLKEEEREVYYALKAHHRDNFPDDIQGLMSDMREYGRIYQIFLDRDHYFLGRGDPQQLANLRLRIKDLVKIKFGVAKPFILRCARDFEEGKLDYENFQEILQILTSYYVRRSVCGDSNALNKFLYPLYRQLEQLENVSADALKRYLGKSVGQTAFPNDDRIKAAFLVRNVYSANQVCKFILLEIEKLSNAEPPREENLEVEHFYPKTPTQEWRDRVGDYFTFEQDYLHNFGNLTLSGQNQKLSNKSYEAKIKLMEEYSSLHLNDYFINNTHSWGIEEVRNRSEYLADQFCQVGLFKDLPKEYRKRELHKTLDDNLTNHNLQSVKLPNDQRRMARNAKELASVVIDYLLENAREAFESYTESQKYIYWDKAKAEARDRDGTLVVPFEKYGFYFVSNASYQTTGSNLKDLILGCDLNPRDFIVE
ncbi:DUF262 domain-containing protein [Helicobacter pylori]|uniref:DUF262 domain-containing protein n=1 Tax=Helicobacter pylori TaxID=210 RepID=UPI000FDDDBF8|nr:DUF262 domain-containing protein [Helicobacter pylori]RVZ05860.1 DUF262 domain-containing protein [Helicobacter pylori]